MSLVAYQRSIRQICRSPDTETTIGLPFVGMVGIPVTMGTENPDPLICGRKHLNPPNRAKRSATI